MSVVSDKAFEYKCQHCFNKVDDSLITKTCNDCGIESLCCDNEICCKEGEKLHLDLCDRFVQYPFVCHFPTFNVVNIVTIKDKTIAELFDVKAIENKMKTNFSKVGYDVKPFLKKESDMIVKVNSISKILLKEKTIYCISNDTMSMFIILYYKNKFTVMYSNMDINREDGIQNRITKYLNKEKPKKISDVKVSVISNNFDKFNNTKYIVEAFFTFSFTLKLNIVRICLTNKKEEFFINTLTGECFIF